ncbi:nicotinate-nucleotide--dimethylbenzimidazole phosphoribosyltransferase [Vibrio navarrensis]|uniref:nicotinate-nucleotide--dimethylbenzimidazole phosphoribosyltransferase n=1 Tax=Vibrio navarrensis TaxID=29495 RepID=UPI001869B623|nr:nicotinate-nucleotide--dimethylbenzimidazole phosphoribosyltransferase [Vibrio navarrensis]MBE4579838.1 nicotinate-nucleotide--dimethylbenzimidazole phosphoribosyltransferase [Vibrio navarrensis]MBE4584935.1 nicotinate-nucleotide--dimethylbenzimidazole phosphoribosyltransferase [Vibrio navarrensis]
MLDQQFAAQIQHIIDNKTKPLGALGQLEKVALQLALIQSQGQSQAAVQIELHKPQMLLFAGDHGIADEGVSIAPSAVTQQMVLNFLAGGAAINCFCRGNDIELTVIDCGILYPVEQAAPNLLLRRLGERTHNFAQQAAMSLEQVEQGLSNGAEIVKQRCMLGADLLMFGEMGIANTSSAAALLSALSGHEVDHCVGKGTGISAEQLSLKIKLVAQGVGRCHELPVKEVLAQVGGFEIVTMVGAFLAAEQQKTPVLVDGFIVSVAAYVATLLQPNVRDYLLFAHRSEEQGHQIVLQLLDAQPLIDLGLRLGEGTGAALAYPLVKAAAQFYNQMASFESAGVTV